MEKSTQTSSIPDTARATRLPVTTVAAERGRKSHRSPFTHPYSQTLMQTLCEKLVQDLKGDWCLPRSLPRTEADRTQWHH